MKDNKNLGENSKHRTEFAIMGDLWSEELDIWN